MKKLMLSLLIMAAFTFSAHSQFKITANNTSMSIHGITDTNFSQSSNSYSYGIWGSDIRFVGFGTQTYTLAAADIDSVNGVSTASATTSMIITILDSITALPAASSGTYTPTISKILNVSSTTARDLTYMRVGNTVTVAGQCNITATASGLATASFTLPVASDFTNVYQAGGAGGGLTGTGSFVATVQANAHSDKIELTYMAPSGSAFTITFTFTYQVL